jgi:hypothetical protein
VQEAVEDVTESEIFPGVMLFSQNLLSTLISSIGYQFSNGYSVFTPTLSWRGWYPVFELSAQLGGPARSLPLPDDITLSGTGHYSELKVKTYVPLVFTRGRNVTSLTPQAEYEFTNTSYYEGGRLTSGLDYLHFRLFMSHYRRMSARDLYPRWGQFLSSTITLTPRDEKQFGSLFSAEAGLFLPGIGAHHHLILRGGFQRQDPENYYLPLNRVDFPRGYHPAVSEQLESLKLDYAFPVICPDLSLGALVYLKRLRMDVFYDWSYGKDVAESGGGRYTGSYRSWGTEVLADFHLIRIIFPFSAGIRTGYLSDSGKVFAEMLFTIRTDGF